ncbi:uncharacterized protein A1O9_10499 [Exophiala aquamarina CBS 119918]|uniref:RING-type domain-containing protein n=1 Tax=Exophiala aquamarina CBS 119918 TaxID=1182545 RepID=A0A072P072_9EURO|nr:uncharacterized protein A1O9_10499 [Exophiala aquamarina CBS 119918]KEF53524.1 hypothetical protein A1O9_10499 [Exophiala aquamarina CBS 119918]
MSQPRSHPSRNPSRTAIDLTLDSDSSTDYDSLHQPSYSSRRQSRHVSRSERGSRAPPFIQNTREETHEVIDLSDDSDFQIQEFAPTADRRPTPFQQSSSPEVEIVHERPVPGGSRRVSPERRQRPGRLPALSPPIPFPSPPPMERGPFGYFPEIIRRSTQFVLGNMSTPWQVPQDHREQLRQINEQARQRHEFRDDVIINFDYRQPAFALGGLEMYERNSETPQVVQEPYKAPTPAKEGFIRTFAEDSVVLCPMCDDELATGGNDTKQQVWVVKGCGHVYCGDCATNRHVSKSKKDKKAASLKSIPFKICAVEGCDTKVGHKTAMFPVYL